MNQPMSGCSQWTTRVECKYDLTESTSGHEFEYRPKDTRGNAAGTDSLLWRSTHGNWLTVRLSTGEQLMRSQWASCCWFKSDITFTHRSWGHGMYNSERWLLAHVRSQPEVGGAPTICILNSSTAGEIQWGNPWPSGAVWTRHLGICETFNYSIDSIHWMTSICVFLFDPFMFHGKTSHSFWD